MSFVFMLASSHKSRQCLLLFLKTKEIVVGLPARDELQLILLKSHFEYYLISQLKKIPFWVLTTFDKSVLRLYSLLQFLMAWLLVSSHFWSFHLFWGWDKWREYQNRACIVALCLWGIRPMSVVSVGIIALTKCSHDFLDSNTTLT